MWNEGESKYLNDLLGVGFHEHLFVCEDGNIKFFYNYDEWKKFHNKLKKVLDSRFFDEICLDYMNLIGKINNAFSKREIDNLSVKLWAIQSIFNEIDECPFIANEYMLNKLLKIRTETHTKQYELERKRKKNKKEPKDYIYFKGELYIKR
ncbi:hypothetical protein ACFL05_00375 [Patescibacteria group bacterium]